MNENPTPIPLPPGRWRRLDSKGEPYGEVFSSGVLTELMEYHDTEVLSYVVAVDVMNVAALDDGVITSASYLYIGPI